MLHRWRVFHADLPAHDGERVRLSPEGLARSSPGPCRIAVGPESGFTAEEVERAIDAGWQRVSLGPRTLRTETAGLAAACVVLHAWGDLGR